MFTQQLIVLISGLDVCYPFLPRPVNLLYYSSRASLWPSAWERVKEEGQSVIDLWAHYPYFFLFCICLHASRPEINSIDSV